MFVRCSPLALALAGAFQLSLSTPKVDWISRHIGTRVAQILKFSFPLPTRLVLLDNYYLISSGYLVRPL
jgi:hypothetical protein